MTMSLLALSSIVLMAAAGEPSSPAAPSSSPTTRPVVDRLLDEVGSVRVRLSDASVADRSLPALVVGVGASRQDLHERQFERDDPNGRLITAAAPVSADEMTRILQTLSQHSFIGGSPPEASRPRDPSSRFVLDVSLRGMHLVQEMNGDRAAELRRLIGQQLNPKNDAAHSAIVETGG